MVTPEGNNLVFILSTPRAGSTLLSTILGNHSSILCPPETWLLLPLRALALDQSIIFSQYNHEAASIAWRQWFDESIFAEASGAFAITIYNRMLSKTTKKIFVDKTPRYYHILPWLDVLFPDARKIWITRNPLDVIASGKSTWGQSVDELLGTILTPNSFDNTISYLLFASWFQRNTSTQYMIKYEDLVASPTTKIKEICNFLDLPFEEQMLNFSHHKETALESSTSTTMGDKKILNTASVHNKSIGRWRSILTSQEVKKILATLGKDIFEKMGYLDVYKEAADLVESIDTNLDSQGILQKLLIEYSNYVMIGKTGPTMAENPSQVIDDLRLRLVHSETVRMQYKYILDRIIRSNAYKFLRKFHRWDWVDENKFTHILAHKIENP